MKETTDISIAELQKALKIKGEVKKIEVTTDGIKVTSER